MFKKPKRNFRFRRQDSGSDDENKSDQSPTHDTLSKSSQSTKAASGKNSEKGGSIKKVASANSVLSFVNEEEGEYTCRWGLPIVRHC
jgi:hypothetical protein